MNILTIDLGTVRPKGGHFIPFTYYPIQLHWPKALIKTSIWSPRITQHCY